MIIGEIKTTKTFTHECSMRNDLRIKALRKVFGIAGYGFWQCMLEVLVSSENFKIANTPKICEILAYDFDIEPASFNRMLNYCYLCDLLTKEEDYIYCKDLINEINKETVKKLEISEKRRVASMKRWEKARTQKLV